MVKKLNAVLIVLGLAFLAYLVWKVGPNKLWLQARALGWGVIPMILAEGLGNLAHTIAWRHCIKHSDQPVPLPRLFRMAMAGWAINYLTPSASVGGEVTRSALLSSTHRGTDAVSSVLLDKLMTALAHLLIAVVGSLFLLWQVRLSTELWVAMVSTTVLMTGGAVLFMWLQTHGKLGGFFRWLANHKLGGRVLQHIARQTSEVDESLKAFYRERRRDLLLSVAWHTLGHSATFLQVWLFLSILNQPASLVTVAGAGFLSLWFDLLTFAIPLNLGTLEGSRIVTFRALGCEALLGITFGLAVRAAQLFWAFFGLVSYSLIATGKPSAPTALARSPGPG